MIKVFFVYTIVALLFLMLSLTAFKILKSQLYNLLFLRLFLIFEFILLCILYNEIINNIKIKKITPYAIFFFVAFCIYNFLKSPLTVFDFFPLVIECLFFTMVILYYFYETMRYNYAIPLYQLPSFWISVAFLIYFSGNFFLFLYSVNSGKDPTFRYQYTLIYSTITMLKNILLCTALIVNKNLIIHKDNTSILSNLDLGKFQPLNNQN